MKFRWLDSPPPESMIRALKHLHVLGAIDYNAKLAIPIGFQISELPGPAVVEMYSEVKRVGM